MPSEWQLHRRKQSDSGTEKPVVMKLSRVMDLGCKLGVIKVNILIYNKTLNWLLVFPRVLDTESNQTLDEYIHCYKDKLFC